MRTPLLVVALTLGILVGCQPGQPLFGPRVVDVAPAERRDVPELAEYPARLVPAARVEIVARTEGYLLERAFEDGTEIEQDQVLFQLESGAYQTALAEAENALAQAAPESVGAAEIRVARAKAELAYTTLRAPIDGRIDEHAIDVGNLVEPGDVLATIVQLDPLLAELRVPHEDLPRLRAAHDEANILTVLETREGRVHERAGRVRDFGGEIDEDGTVLVRAVVPNPRLDLLGGSAATARLVLRWHEGAIVVPAAAVHEDDEDSFVWVVGDDGRVARHVVTLGPAYANLRVLLSGLAEGQNVVVGRSYAAVEGRSVETELASPRVEPTPRLPPRLWPSAEQEGGT